MDSSLLYIDPNTGSALIAMILGAAAGISMYIKTKWQSLKYKINSKK